MWHSIHKTLSKWWASAQPKLAWNFGKRIDTAILGKYEKKW
jgi:hypothetical protein